MKKSQLRQLIKEALQNKHNVILNFTNDILLKRFKQIPTFQKMLAPNQMNNLKIGDNNLTINNVSLNGLERMESMGLYKISKLKDLNESKSCSCGCNSCGDKKAPLINESLKARIVMTENMKHHIDNKIALVDTKFKPGTKQYNNLWDEARFLYSRNAINVCEADKKIIVENRLNESKSLSFPIFVEATEKTIDKKLSDMGIKGHKLPHPYVGIDKDGFLYEMFMENKNGKRGWMVHKTDRKIKPEFIPKYFKDDLNEGVYDALGSAYGAFSTPPHKKSEKWKIVYGDDEEESTERFNSRAEAYDFIESYTSDSQEERYNRDGEDEWYTAYSYYNPDDKQNYRSASPELEHYQLNETKIDYEEEYQKIKQEIMIYQGYSEDDMEEEDIENEVNRDADEEFEQKFGFPPDEIPN